MSQSFWEPEEAVEEVQPTELQEAEAADPAALALSVDDFSALEERILRAVDLVKRERTSRAEAEERARQAEAQLAAQAAGMEEAQKEVGALRVERDHVRQRVERLLSQLDALEL